MRLNLYQIPQETKDKDDEEKIKAAEKRIKLGLILNEYGEKIV